MCFGWFVTEFHFTFLGTVACLPDSLSLGFSLMVSFLWSVVSLLNCLYGVIGRRKKKILWLFSWNKGWMKQIHVLQLRGICLDKMCSVLFLVICMKKEKRAPFFFFFFFNIVRLTFMEVCQPFQSPRFLHCQTGVKFQILGHKQESTHHPTEQPSVLPIIF